MKKFLVLLAFAFVSAPMLAEGEDSLKSSHYFSIDGGFGMGILGFQYNAGLAYRLDATLVGMRFLRTGGVKGIELGSFGGGTTQYQRPVESISELCAYIGRSASDKGFRATALVGLAFTSGTLRGNFIRNDGSYDHFETNQIQHFTVPVEGQLTFIPYDYFGINLSYYINLNLAKSCRGFSFGVQYTLH